MKINDPKERDWWLKEALELLTHTELRVFIAWFIHHEKFNPSASEIRKQLPFLSNNNIRKAFASLSKKGFIKVASRRPQANGWAIAFRELWPREVAEYMHGQDRENQKKLKSEKTKKKVSKPKVVKTEKVVKFTEERPKDA